MNYFKTVKAALDASFDAICTNRSLEEAEACKLIKGHLETMNEEWFSGETPNIAYEDPLCRFAYLYCHTAVNANLCEVAIRETPSLKSFVEGKLDEDQELGICAFGGGPGTELLSLSKHVLKYRKGGPPAQLSFTLLDRVPEWAETWNVLESRINSELRESFGHVSKRPFIISKTFSPFDMTKLSHYGNVVQLFQQDLYLLNYVISEVLGGTEKLQRVLTKMAEGAPKGSKVVIIDRNQPKLVAAAKQILSGAGLKVSKVDESSSNMDHDEQLSALEPYVKRIGRNPRVQWKQAFWITGTKG